MCGIFGFVGTEDPQFLRRAAHAQDHRGPDGFGEYAQPLDSRDAVPVSSLSKGRDFVYLAHNRLSIIDLSERGRQPMANEDGSVQLVFNGEIYNYLELRKELIAKGHRFASDTDSEVIVHAYEEWGFNCVDRFCGMFAFAIWDSRNRRMFIARDRIGIKPLYLWQAAHGWAFASEAKAFFPLPEFRKRLNPDALAGFLFYSYVPGTESIWQSVRRLNPGEWMTYDVDRRVETVRNYWRIDRPIQPRTFSDATEQLEELLKLCVKQHLISDVPLGVFLSGGIDSGTVLAMAAAERPQVESFTIGFTGWDNSEIDEAAATAKLLGSRHRSETVGTKDFGNLSETMALFDEPMADSSIVPTNALCREASQHFKVALSGDGGDEMFGGYRWYGHLERDPLRRQLSYFLARLKTRWGRTPAWPAGCENRHEFYRLLTSPSFSAREVADLIPSFPRETAENYEKQMVYEHFREDAGAYRRWRMFDTETFLVYNNLARVDSLSMRCG